MERRQFFRLFLCAAAVPQILERPITALAQVKSPLHECIDRPDLPCPACEKWEGDPFATVRCNPTILSA